MSQQESGNKNPFDETIDELSKTLKNIEKENKSGKKKDEEVEKDPSMILFQSIVESTKRMLESDTVNKLFADIATRIGTPTTKSLIEVLSTLMTFSAHNALIVYDELLKAEMQTQFDHISEHINFAKADIAAHDAVLKIHGKAIEEIKSSIQIEKFSKENGIKQ